MLRITDLSLPLDHDEEQLRHAIIKQLRIRPDTLVQYHVCRRSVDARKRRPIRLIYTIDAQLRDEAKILRAAGHSRKISPAPDTTYHPPIVATTPPAHRPVIVGTGPCGLFAGLLLTQMGIPPILIERGRPATERARDVARFWRDGTLDPQSNVQFGEGGAGTFSDGKLYTQIKDRANRGRKVLEELIRAGASDDILVSAKPHIGTDVLIRVVTNLRHAIESAGGEIRFETCATDLIIENGAIRGVVLDDGSKMRTDAVVLAVGHSARDTFVMLHRRGVEMEPKPFSMGVRIEHPQRQIDEAQFGRSAGHPRLGAADYRLVEHVPGGRSAYTFCMCPGGQVIGASSEPGGVVTNGMSSSARDLPNANSGLLVGVVPADFGDAGPLAGVAFQRKWEQLAFQLGGEDYRAPAQLVGDFLAGRPSRQLGDVVPTYRPGIVLGDVSPSLPPYVSETIRAALPGLERRLTGFARPDAVLTAVETRSSSPVRVLRGDSGESVSTPGLYPAGEGAGYAGGIMSAAVDGIRIAESIAQRLSTPQASR